MYQIPKPPNQPNPKELLLILATIGMLSLINWYRWK